MPDEPHISFGQAFEVSRPNKCKSQWVSCCQKYLTRLKFFLWAMPDEPQISFGQALEVFQGQISVKVNGCHVAQNILHGSNFFCEHALMNLKSVLVKLWRAFKAK